VKRYDVTNSYGTKIGEIHEVPDVEGAVAGFLTLIVVIGALIVALIIIAVVVGLLVAALVGLGLIVARFLDSARSDIASRRLSLTTVGLGLPLLTLPIIIAIIVTTPWASKNFAGNPAFIAAVIIFYAWFVGLVFYSPMKVGVALRSALRGLGGWGRFVGWALLAAFMVDFVITANSTPYHAVDAFDATVNAAFYSAMQIALAGGAVAGVAQLLRPR
jgi:hypothetical protein